MNSNNSNSEADEFRLFLEANCRPNWHIVTSEFENASSSLITLIVEPYGTGVIINPGTACTIIGEEPKGLGISITVSDSVGDNQNIYMQIWAGDWMEVFQDRTGYAITGQLLEWRKNVQGETK